MPPVQSVKEIFGLLQGSTAAVAGAFNKSQNTFRLRDTMLKLNRSDNLEDKELTAKAA
jgi:hypothetical protein